jgi:hypothetical protein
MKYRLCLSLNNPSSKLNPVNTTESKICGIPKTQPSNVTTTLENTMSKGIAPSEAPLEPPQEG